MKNRFMPICKGVVTIMAVALTCLVLSQNALAQKPLATAPKVGDAVSVWFKDKTFNELYKQALGRSPANSPKSWVFTDAGIAPSMPITGQNANTWVRLSTCASKNNIAQCRLNHVDVFYDPPSGELFGYLSLGNRQGWVGAPRAPTSMEQKFLSQHTTRDLLQQ